jgi:hypothetical protein
MYIGENIERITCTECNAYVKIDEKMVISAIGADIVSRVTSKPERMSNEIKENLSKFLKSMPKRVVTKPYRIIKELKDIKDRTCDKNSKNSS